MNRVENFGYFMGIDLWVLVNMCVTDQQSGKVRDSCNIEFDSIGLMDVSS